MPVIKTVSQAIKSDSYLRERYFKALSFVFKDAEALLTSRIPAGVSASQSIGGFNSDTRSLAAGEIFVAIKGDHFDGHRFVAAAAEKGALAAIVSQDFSEATTLPLFRVGDPTQALRSIAKAYRELLTLPIIAVAGSNGKTTTKEWIAFLLQEHLRRSDKDAQVFKTAKSLNSVLGIALSLLNIRDEKFAVIEIGIDEPGWMEQHLDVVQPTCGVITVITEEHLNLLKNIETVAEEELKLFHYLRQKPAASFAANRDSSWVKTAQDTVKMGGNFKILSYGLQERADIEGSYRAPDQLHAFGMEFTSPLPGQHNAQNLLAAFTVLQLQFSNLELVDFAHLQSRLGLFQGEAHRSRWVEIANQVRVFDDCYNANPSSIESALKTFVELSDGCRQHIVLGDMLDLGDSSADAHRRVLNIVSVLNFDRIYLLGPLFKKARSSLAIPPLHAVSFDTHPELLSELKKGLQKGDTVFLKGSRGMRLEIILEALENGT